MGFFDFLRDANSEKKAVKGAFGFLGQTARKTASGAGKVATVPYNETRRLVDAATGNRQAEQNANRQADRGIAIATRAPAAARDVATAVARGVARVPETIARSSAQAGFDIAGKIDHAPPLNADQPTENTGLKEAIYGKEPIQTYQKRAQGVSDKTKISAPLVAFGLLGGDVTPLGKGKKVEEGLTKLSRASTTAEVRNVMKGTDPALVDKVAHAIAQTKDPHVIRNIIDKANNPLPKNPDMLPTPEASPAVRDIAKATVPEAPDLTHFKSLADNSTDFKDFSEKFKALPPTPDLQSAIGKLPHDMSLEDFYGKLKQRSFLKTTQKSDILTDEAKQKVANIEPQQYAQKKNTGLVSIAKEAVAKDRQGIKDDLLTKEHYTDQDVANAGELVRQAFKDQRTAEKAGDTALADKHAEYAARLVEVADTRLRASGRTTQAAALWGRLTPEGILKAVTRKVAKTREALPGVEKEQPLAKKLKDTVEGIGGIEKGDVRQTIKGIVNDVTKQEKSVGEQVAKKIETTVTPRAKKKADELVLELTKKIKQESLAPKTTVKKDPLNTLREVFNRHPEAKEAYPEAQRILRDKFVDNPKALDALDKFFSSELGLPAASTTINSAIKNQLIKGGERIPDIIHKSWANQKRSVEDISKELVKEGFDPKSAKSLADEVVKRLNKQLGEAKGGILERLAAKAPKRAQPSYLEKIQKLSNLGGLDDADYLHLARNHLKLPNLSTEQSKEVSRLAQKMQGMEGGAEKTAVIRDIQKIVNEATGSGKTNVIVKLFSSFKALKATGDLSGGGRQGGFLGTRWARDWASSQRDSIKAAKSQKYYDDGIAAREADPFSATADDWGLDVVKSDGVMHEEQYPSNYADKIPGVGASDRAFTYGLSDFRFKVGKKIYEKEKLAGNDPASWSKREKEAMGRYINTSSGRGDLGAFLDEHATTLNTALFSAKLWKSRLDIINPKYYWDLRGTTAEKYALQNLASFTATAAVILGLAEAAGASVSTDARSSDFLKIKVGDTRYDVLGGLQQNLVAVWRETSGQKKSSQTGKVTDLTGGNFGAANRLTVLSDLFGGKEAPGVSETFKQIRGTDQSGKKLTPSDRGKSLASLVLPLGISDTASTVKNKSRDGGYNAENIAKGIAMSSPGFVGAGVGTYGVRDLPITSSQTKYIQKLRNQGAPKEKVDATKLFYQVIKTAPSKTDASDKVNKILGDDKIPLDKAVTQARQIAKDYNNKYYDAVDKGWLQKYKKYGDERMVKDFDKGKLKLDDAAIRKRLDKIKEDKASAPVGG